MICAGLPCRYDRRADFAPHIYRRFALGIFSIEENKDHFVCFAATSERIFD